MASIAKRARAGPSAAAARGLEALPLALGAAVAAFLGTREHERLGRASRFGAAVARLPASCPHWLHLEATRRVLRRLAEPPAPSDSEAPSEADRRRRREHRARRRLPRDPNRSASESSTDAERNGDVLRGGDGAASDTDRGDAGGATREGEPGGGGEPGAEGEGAGQGEGESERGSGPDGEGGRCDEGEGEGASAGGWRPAAAARRAELAAHAGAAAASLRGAGRGQRLEAAVGRVRALAALARWSRRQLRAAREARRAALEARLRERMSAALARTRPRGLVLGPRLCARPGLATELLRGAAAGPRAPRLRRLELTLGVPDRGLARGALDVRDTGLEQAGAAAACGLARLRELRVDVDGAHVRSDYWPEGWPADWLRRRLPRLRRLAWPCPLPRGGLAWLPARLRALEVGARGDWVPSLDADDPTAAAPLPTLPALRRLALTRGHLDALRRGQLRALAAAFPRLRRLAAPVALAALEPPAPGCRPLFAPSLRRLALRANRGDSELARLRRLAPLRAALAALPPRLRALELRGPERWAVSAFARACGGPEGPEGPEPAAAWARLCARGHLARLRAFALDGLDLPPRVAAGLLVALRAAAPRLARLALPRLAVCGELDARFAPADLGLGGCAALTHLALGADGGLRWAAAALPRGLRALSVAPAAWWADDAAAQRGLRLTAAAQWAELQALAACCPDLRQLSLAQWCVHALRLAPALPRLRHLRLGAYAQEPDRDAGAGPEARAALARQFAACLRRAPGRPRLAVGVGRDFPPWLRAAGAPLLYLGA